MSQLVSLRMGHGIEATTTSLSIPPQSLNKESWSEVAAGLARVGVGYTWWVADLAAYARHYLEDANKRLDELAGLINAKSSYVGTLASVSKAFPVKDRIAQLSVSHHIVVMHRPHAQRQRLLRIAKSRGWSTARLAEKSIPKDERTFKIVLKVPYKHLNSKKFNNALKTFKEEFEIASFMQGAVRIRNRIGQKRVPMITAS